MKGLVYGVGSNDAEYAMSNRQATTCTLSGRVTYKILWICPFYSRWKDMLRRCYSDKFQMVQPTYIGCSVCEEWLTFSNFKSWMERQDWEDKELDKDLLFTGNKIYSPGTCVFISRKVNAFIREKVNGDTLTGVAFDKRTNNYKAQCNSVITGKVEYLGKHATELEAHKIWKAFKFDQAVVLASKQTDERVAKALIDRYNDSTFNEEETK